MSSHEARPGNPGTGAPSAVHRRASGGSGHRSLRPAHGADHGHQWEQRQDGIGISIGNESGIGGRSHGQDRYRHHPDRATAAGEQMAVAVTKVISSASPGDEITAAPAGDRLYAVQFRLHDTGSAAYSDSPSNGAEVVDSAGQSYQASITDTAAGCTTFPASENIAPGSSGLGCIVFEVPKAAKVTAVQFTLDSGMGPQTGQWSVTG